MLTLFWLSFVIVAWTYAGYPIVMSALARLRSHPWQRSPFPASVSVLMAVHNGAHLLPAQLEHLRSLPAELVRELIVISDGSHDQTAPLLLAARALDSRFQPIILTEQVGKASALNHGLARATSEILLFLDIRPRIASGSLPELLSNFADPGVGCVAGELVLATAGLDAGASAVSGVYWRYEQWIRNCEAAFDSPVGVYGGFYAIRRALATPFPAGIVLDDMFQPLSIIRQGYRSVLDRAAIVHDTWPGKVAGEFQRKVRTLSGNFQLLQLAPWILTPHNRVWPQLLSHKLLRLVVPYLLGTMLLASAALGLHSPLWALVATAQASLWILAALSLRFKLPVIQRYAAAAGAMLVLNAAAVAGLYRFLATRGPLWKTWSVQPAGRPSHAAAASASQADSDTTDRSTSESARMRHQPLQAQNHIDNQDQPYRSHR